MLKDVLNSNYCRAIFVVSMFVSFFILPSFIFMGWLVVLAVVFMLVFSLSMACMIRSIKDMFSNARRTGRSLLSIISMLLGFSAFHACTIGAPVCASAGIGLLLTLLPSFMLGVLSSYSILIIVVSIFLQLFVLSRMGCLRYK